MSEPSASWSQPGWPPDLPGPGSGTWPQSAVDWLHDHVPANRWRHKHLAADPWLYALSTAAVVRGQLEQARAEWHTVHQWAGQPTPKGARALVRATVAEGNRLKTLLGHVMAIEDALMAERLRPGVRPRP